MRTSVFRGKEIWDVLVSRKSTLDLTPVWIVKDKKCELLCQVQHEDRFGWTVIVSGDVKGLRMVAGFKQRWQAIRYATEVRTDIGWHDE